MAEITKRSKKDTGSAWLTRGEPAAKRAREQAATTFRPELWMYDGEAAKVVFLDKESYNIHIHSLKVRGRFRKYTCPRRNCPLCRVNDARLIAVYRVLDLRKFEKKDKDGKSISGLVAPYKEKYYEVGSRLQQTVARLMGANRLYKKLAEISRDGTGKSTTYQISALGAISEKLKRKLGDMLTPKLDVEKDYAPKDPSDMKELAASFGAYDEEDDDDGETVEPTVVRKYLDDEDEDDIDDGIDEDDYEDEDLEDDE